MRDNVAEIVSWMGLLTGTLGKIGTDVLMMMQTEVGEVFEAEFGPKDQKTQIACGWMHHLEAKVGTHK